MIGVVDVGGGTRGIYGAGVFDTFMEKKISFDILAGVSAGSANIASFKAGQFQRNLKFYTDYAFRAEYMGFKELVRHGNYINLEYIYGALSNHSGEYPLDFGAILSSPGTFYIVTTDALTGKPVYFTASDMEQDDYGAIKGSSCVPVVDHPYDWKGYKLFDGGLSDPIPYRLCLEKGCEKVLVILTRPKDYRRSDRADRQLARFIRRTYPKSAALLRNRASLYNSQLDEAVRLEQEGKLLIIAPESIGEMKTLTRDVETIRWLYDRGRKDAEKIEAFL